MVPRCWHHLAAKAGLGSRETYKSVSDPVAPTDMQQDSVPAILNLFLYIAYKAYIAMHIHHTHAMYRTMYRTVVHTVRTS